MLANTWPVISPSPRVRRSPFFDATIAAGAASVTVYNHMYMVTGYGDPEGEYWRLINGVSMWDVSCERQVALRGPDAGRLAQVLCPRKLDKMKPGVGWYVPICDHNGTLLNDPILLKLAEDHYWLSIADNDLLFWAKAIGAERGLDVEVTEPDVSPLAIQGPKAMDVVADLFGPQVRDMRYFHFVETNLEGIPILLQRSGWSKQGGFELYLRDGSQGTALWNKVRQAGAPYGIAPGNPNPIERVESGLLSFGGDTDAQTNPFEVRMEKYVHLDAPDDVVGIEALRQIAAAGPKRHQLGVKLTTTGKLVAIDQPARVRKDGTDQGKMTTNTWSPRLQCNIGICLVSSSVQVEDPVEITLPTGETVAGQMCPLPFL